MLEYYFERHLKKALSHTDRPWEVVPNYRKDVEIVYDPAKAARVVDKMRERGGPVAFDYETNMLKPYGSNARIVSCSVCWRGKKTIAFPWHGPIIPAMKKLLLSDSPKIASNQKFEHCWSIAKLGVQVRNWMVGGDTMLNAHILDNRKAITSIKFQSFVHLGQEDYDHHIKGLLKADTSILENKITEINLQNLLEYNGMDSLLEYKVCEIQRRQLKL